MWPEVMSSTSLCSFQAIPTEELGIPDGDHGSRDLDHEYEQ